MTYKIKAAKNSLLFQCERNTSDRVYMTFRTEKTDMHHHLAVRLINSICLTSILVPKISLSTSP